MLPARSQLLAAWLVALLLGGGVAVLARDADPATGDDVATAAAVASTTSSSSSTTTSTTSTTLAPPTTVVVTTAPPATEPPTSAPPVTTAPPATAPPATAPPATAPPVTTAPPAPMPGLAGEVIADHNAERTSRGIAALASDPCLDQLAQAWADHMAATGLAHNPSGLSDAKACTGGRNAGENVAYNFSLDQVHATWMASTPHRTNMLNPAYSLVGIGVAQRADGSYWVVVDFAG